MLPARRRRQQRFGLLLGLLLGILAALGTEAWQRPFAHQLRRQQQRAHLQQRAISVIGPLSAAQTTRPAEGPTTTTTATGGNDGVDKKTKEEDEGPMDAVRGICRVCMW